MCGIAGLFQRDGGPADAQAAKRMGETLAHRGPDDDGLWADGPIALAHRRLSIIDLSAGGHQPMADEARQACVTYNGEVYNYRALRRELESLGHRFRSASDTEVVLRAYLQWGAACLRRLVGMFALAIWDARSRTLLLARDPLGIKPLFYAQRPQTVVFGSEIKAVLASNLVTPQLDPDGLLDCLTFGAVIAPRTMFAGIRQLPPAHAAAISAEHVRLWRYWSPLDGQEPARSDAQWLEGLRERLESAVAGCLQSDAPVGVLLSAGLDSNIVAGLMARRAPEPVPSFTMGFREPSFDETPLAAQAARHHGLLPRVGTVPEERLVESVERVVWHAEEPTANPSFVATWHLARLAAREVKVVLSGDGADELFAGYETYPATLLAERLRRLVPAAALRAFGAVADAIPGGFRRRSLRDSLRRFLHGAARPGLDRHGLWRAVSRPEQSPRLVSPRLREALRGRDALAGSYGAALGSRSFRTTLQALLYADVTVYLPNDGLVKMDRMAMAHGLEVRVPLLNHDLAEYAFAMPDHLKWTPRAGGKIALKRLAAGMVPEPVLRARKMGFNAPAAAWLRGPLRAFALDTLAPAALRADGIFDEGAVSRLIEPHMAGFRDHALQLWMVLVISLWHRTFMTSAWKARFAAPLRAPGDAYAHPIAS